MSRGIKERSPEGTHSREVKKWADGEFERNLVPNEPWRQEMGEPKK